MNTMGLGDLIKRYHYWCSFGARLQHGKRTRDLNRKLIEAMLNTVAIEKIAPWVYDEIEDLWKEIITKAPAEFTETH